jgi:transcriptional regulator with XRE-family HTH domain
VAKRLGFSASTFQRLVAGKSRVTPDMALRIARVLGRRAESWLSSRWSLRRLCVRPAVGLDQIDFGVHQVEQRDIFLDLHYFVLCPTADCVYSC